MRPIQNDPPFRFRLTHPDLGKYAPDTMISSLNKEDKMRSIHMVKIREVLRLQSLGIGIRATATKLQLLPEHSP